MTENPLAGVQNVDAFHRMNFLYQVCADPTHVAHSGHFLKAAMLALTGPAPNAALSRFYIATLRNVAERCVLRLFACE